MKKIIVYTLEDPRDGLVKYVGITNRPKIRFSEHLRENENNKKCAWIKKLKSLGLIPIFKEIDITDENNYKWVEMYWISQFKTWGFELKNMTEGGDGTFGLIPWNKGLIGEFAHSEESKLKMSECRKENTSGEKNGFFGKKHSTERKESWSEKRVGNKHTDETKNKIRKSNIKNSKPIFCYTLDGEFVKKYICGTDTNKDGFNSNMVSKVCIGKHKSHMKHVFSFCEIKNFKKENYIKQIWNKGIFGVYKHSEETKNNMSNKRKGKKININNQGDKNPNSKMVYCYDLKFNLIKKYEYTRQVEEDNLNYDMIRKRCKNKNLKPYKGFIFSNDILNK